MTSVPIPVTHMQCPPIAGCLRCRWDQRCHCNDPAEASHLWLGRAGRGWKAQQGQEWDWKIDTEGNVPGLRSPWDGAGPLLWGQRLQGGGKDWAAPSPFSSRAAEPPPGLKDSILGALGLLTAPQDGERESQALALLSAPGVGAEESGAIEPSGAPQGRGWRRGDGDRGPAP